MHSHNHCVTTTNPQSASELTLRRRLLVLAICCLSLLVVGMDVTIVNVALPSIRTDLGASVSGLQWIIDAYTVVLASLLILSGSTADRLGRRRTFQLVLVFFSVGSLLCGVAPGLGWLIGFQASHRGWWIVGGYAAAVFVLAWVSTGRRAQRSASKVAHLLDDAAHAEAPATVTR